MTWGALSEEEVKLREQEDLRLKGKFGAMRSGVGGGRANLA